MFKNFHNSLNSLEYLSNSMQFTTDSYNYFLTFKTQLHHRTWLKIDNDLHSPLFFLYCFYWLCKL